MGQGEEPLCKAAQTKNLWFPPLQEEGARRGMKRNGFYRPSTWS